MCHLQDYQLQIKESEKKPDKGTKNETLKPAIDGWKPGPFSRDCLRFDPSMADFITISLSDFFFHVITARVSIEANSDRCVLPEGKGCMLAKHKSPVNTEYVLMGGFKQFLFLSCGKERKNHNLFAASAFVLGFRYTLKPNTRKREDSSLQWDWACSFRSRAGVGNFGPSAVVKLQIP